MVDGHSGAFPYFSARYRFIAIDSHRRVPLSSRAGICPLGFILRYSGFRGSPVNPTGTCSYLAPTSSSAHRLRAARDIDVPYNLITGSLDLPNLLPIDTIILMHPRPRMHSDAARVSIDPDVIRTRQTRIRNCGDTAVRRRSRTRAGWLTSASRCLVRLRRQQLSVSDRPDDACAGRPD